MPYHLANLNKIGLGAKNTSLVISQFLTQHSKTSTYALLQKENKILKFTNAQAESSFVI